MTRPLKQTMAYFPHLVGDSQTKTILQAEFGNDGYAFWFKLLELLCISKDQVYDYSKSAGVQFLLAKTHVNGDKAEKILQVLADLEAIDPELHKKRIIWSQNLVDNLSLVYKRRATGAPERPVSNNPSKRVNVDNNPEPKQEKAKHGEFNNVLLASEEYQKLKDKFGTDLKRIIENFSAGIAAKNYGYKSHYAAILKWEQNARAKEEAHGANKKGVRPHGEYTDPAKLRENLRRA